MLQMPTDEIRTRILNLCVEKGVSVNKALFDFNLNKSVVDNLTKGSMLSADKVVVLSKYFNITTDYLLGISEKKNSPNTTKGNEAVRSLQDPLDIELFEKFSGLTADQKDLILAQIEGILNHQSGK